MYMVWTVEKLVLLVNAYKQHLPSKGTHYRIADEDFKTGFNASFHYIYAFCVFSKEVCLI